MLTHRNAHVRRLLAHRTPSRSPLTLLSRDPIEIVSSAAAARLTAHEQD